MYFEQKKGEEVIEVIRKSFYTLFPGILKAFSFSLPAIFVLLFMDVPLLTLVSFGWLIIILAYFLYVWLVWYYDVYILTTDRIIDVHHKSLFAKEVMEVGLDKIQDVSYSIDGFGSSLLGYGTVKIHSETAINIQLESVPSPEETHKIILELKEDKT